MIQGSFCSKLNALSYDIYLIFLCLISSFFRWTSKILTERTSSWIVNGQKEFQIPLADQVLFFVFYFFKFVKIIPIAIL